MLGIWSLGCPLALDACIDYIVKKRCHKSYQCRRLSGDGTALLPLDAAVTLLPASLQEFGIKHVEFKANSGDGATPSGSSG